MVDLMNSTVTTFALVLLRLLNSHLSTGILDNSGIPEELSSFSVRSKPPNTMVSSLWTRKLVSNLLTDCGGGEPSVGIEVKSDILTLMPSVTWSSPETIGLILIDRSASTSWKTLVKIDWALETEGITFWVVFL